MYLCPSGLARCLEAGRGVGRWESQCEARVLNGLTATPGASHPGIRRPGGGGAEGEEGAPKLGSHPFAPLDTSSASSTFRLPGRFKLTSSWQSPTGPGQRAPALSALPAGCPWVGCLPPPKVPSRSPSPVLAAAPSPACSFLEEIRAPAVAGPWERSAKFPAKGQRGSRSSREGKRFSLATTQLCLYIPAAALGDV